MPQENEDQRIITGAWIDWDRVPENSYFRDVPALTTPDYFELPSPITFFTGENGSGKSSLLEALASACGFDRGGGTKRDLVHSDDMSSDLGHALHVSYNRSIPSGFFFRAETFFDLAKHAPVTRDVGVSGKAYTDYLGMSHGEGFLEFLQSQQYAGLYLMDEPEAALSVQRQLTLMLHMHYMAASGSQFIVITHSPVLLGMPEASILRFDEEGAAVCAWEETDAYQITKMFLDDREAVLHHLYSE